MKRPFSLLTPLLLIGTATAQSPDSTTMNLSVEGGSPVPTTTIIPVAKPPIKEVDTTYTLSSTAKERLSRRDREQAEFSSRLDSLIRSRNFLFYPDTMQSAEPSGLRHNIYAQYFYLGIFTDTAEVHLPTSVGHTQRGGVLNFDSPIYDFKILPFDSGWSVTFRLIFEGRPYFARIVISAITGESILSLVTPDATIRYIGQLTHKRRLHFPEA